MSAAVEVVVVEAVRSAFAKRGGELSAAHPADVLGAVQRTLLDRAGVDPGTVGQVIGGCVNQAGEQALNVARTAWLSAGLPLTVAATTVDAQCGSAQQATALAGALVGAGVVELAVGCGVEIMSRIPIGANVDPRWGHPAPSSYRDRYEWTSQFEGAERVARAWSVTRDDADRYAVLSQERAAAAWGDGRFDAQIAAVEVPAAGGDGEPVAERTLVARDGAMRPTTMEGLSRLKPVHGDDGVHTAGSSSQIADGAAAVLLASARAAEELGLRPMARIVDQCLVGSDPEIMLTGPIGATRFILERNGLTLDDLDVVEINEAFASVVIAWQRELGADLAKVNPNGGAIATGHPLGATGAALITKAVHELARTGGRLGLVTMCCGGGLGTGMLLERL